MGSILYNSLAQKISADFTHPRIFPPVPDAVAERDERGGGKNKQKGEKQLWQSYP